MTANELTHFQTILSPYMSNINQIYLHFYRILARLKQNFLAQQTISLGIFFANIHFEGILIHTKLNHDLTDTRLN